MKAESRIQRVAIIGLGAIGSRVLLSLQQELLPGAQYAVLEHPNSAAKLATYPELQVFHQLDGLIEWRPDLVVECAGHAAVTANVPALLEQGIDVVVVSVGALADAELRERLNKAAHQGGGKLTLVSGAIGGMDALSAAKTAGLETVRYVGRKPPHAWEGSPAQNLFDLAAIKQPTAIFLGNAADAARLYPKNANVTAAIALAGIGFDQTEVELVADPTVTKNVHEVEAFGAFGSLKIRLENNPLPDNPKTSWLAALSIEEALRKHLIPISL